VYSRKIQHEYSSPYTLSKPERLALSSNYFVGYHQQENKIVKKILDWGEESSTNTISYGALKFHVAIDF
jgi:hypothetical protein